MSEQDEERRMQAFDDGAPDVTRAEAVHAVKEEEYQPPEVELVADPNVEAEYRHPQGKTIVVYKDGTYMAFDANGKRQTTSATPKKLAEGYGRWVRVK